MSSEQQIPKQQQQQQTMSAITDSFFIGEISFSKDGPYELSSGSVSSNNSSPSPSPTAHLNQFDPDALSTMMAECGEVFRDPVNCMYRWETDDGNNISGTVDFISKKRNNRKAPERVICLKPTDKISYFSVTCAYFNGEDVSSDYLDNLFLRVKPSSVEVDVATSATSASASTTSSFGTPSAKSTSAGCDKTRDLFDTAPRSKTNMKIHSSMVMPLLQAFFSDSCIQTCADEQFTLSEKALDSSDNLEKLMMNHVVTPSLFTSMEIDGPIPILISIEGNIGAGKSTLLRALRAKSDLDWCFIDEPVDTWTSLKNDDDVSLLELFYGDQRRWSYTFQNCAVLSRFQNIEKTVANQRIKEPHKKYKVFVTERCLQTDYQVFAKMMRADGKMDRLEFDLYKRWYNLIEATATRLSAIVYVDTEPDVCFDRIRMRNRDGEEGIPLAYLSSLHKFQNEMIDNSGVPQCRVKSIDIEQAIQFVDGLIAKI